MERLTKCIDNHFPDIGKMVKEYDLNDEIEFNDYSCMDIPNAVYNKLGQLEDVLEEFGIESVEELRNHLNYKENMAIWEGKLALKKENAELKSKLSKAIVLPDFEKGQEIFVIHNNEIVKANFQDFSKWIDADIVYNPHTTIDDDGFVDVDYDLDMVDYKMVFATKEEAQAKLDEIRRK